MADARENKYIKAGISSAVFNALVENKYDWLIDFDAESGRVKCLYVSDFILDNGINPDNYSVYDDLCTALGKRLVVEEERESFMHQVRICAMMDDIKNKGSYARTVHFYDGRTVRAESIRVTHIENNRYLMMLINVTIILDHDWMTDEYSRSGFITRAEELFREPEYAQGYSVVYTNVKGFKAMNDLLGTYTGDMIIFMLRDVLVKGLKPVLIARLESDHFALLTKNENITPEILDEFCPQVYEEGTKRLPFTIRCGIYNVKNPNRTIQHMLDRAKLAEKSISDKHGVPYAVCDDKMSNNYMLRRRLISEIDVALKNGEFKAYYQPVVDAKTGEIVSAEALIRWIHPELGVISPGIFVPIFEEEGLVTKIDSFMASSVMNINAARMEQGKNVVPCAVNLSRVDFFIKEDGEVIFNEINTFPGFTDISMYPMLFETIGVEKRKLIADLIDSAFERMPY